MDDSLRPLSGIKVIEMTHMVMGPAVGSILGDLGADVIKIEPVTAVSYTHLTLPTNREV